MKIFNSLFPIFTLTFCMLLNMTCGDQMSYVSVDGHTPNQDSYQSSAFSFTPTQFSTCFSQLHGPVEYNCSAVESLHTFNMEKLNSLLTKLVSTPYFTYFRVNLERSCLFWTPSFHCTDNECNLECCSHEEVPFIELERVCHGSSEDPAYLGEINNTISSNMNIEINTWSLNLPGDICFCDPGTQFDSDCKTYYDLASNREQYTAYGGKEAHRIWNSIYKENCFKPATTAKSNKLTSIYAENKLNNLCIEKRAFYRLISGLHTSISIHLCNKYKFPCDFLRREKWGVNLDEFFSRFNPTSTENQGPVWLKNLYFTFLVELKALLKSEKVLNTATFYTGNFTQDLYTKQLVLYIIEEIKQADINFNETMVFFTDYANIVSLKNRFRNITRIMDCVSCQRCRLWGKLQIKAIATSLNILFHSHSLNTADECDNNNNILNSITRTEVVALLNGLAKLSESIAIIESYKNYFNS